MLLPEILPNSRVLITGMTGTGKSMLAHWLFWSTPPEVTIYQEKNGKLVEVQAPFWRLVFDVSNSIIDPGSVTFEDPNDIPWEESLSLRFVPDIDQDVMFAQADILYSSVLAHGFCNVWCDEVGEITTAHKAPGGLRGVIMRGRKEAVGSINATPSPHDIYTGLRKQALHIFIFNQTDPGDIQTLGAIVGLTSDELDDILRSMAPYHYLWYAVEERRLLLMDPLPAEIIQLMGGLA